MGRQVELRIVGCTCAIQAIYYNLESKSHGAAGPSLNKSVHLLVLANKNQPKLGRVRNRMHKNPPSTDND